VNALSSASGQPNFEGGLHTRRCVRHDAREAAARCPGCSRDFCRECVIDHAGRLLCAGCVAKLTATKVGASGSRWPAVRRVCTLGAAVVTAWFAFFLVGKLLLAIPSAVHEGTIWKVSSATP